MLFKKLLAGILTAALVVTAIPAGHVTVGAEEAGQSSNGITISKNSASEVNPIGGYDDEGNLVYGGDPSILVDGDTVYLYVGHDTSTGEGYFMPEWCAYSTKDLKEWKYEGVVMKADKAAIRWANTGTDAWAGQVEKYNDKYYFYYCTWDATADGEQSIGVAVSDSPTEGFEDIGEPLVRGTVTNNKSGKWSAWNDIDPTVWVEKDADGVEHRYLCWGNNKLFMCELNEDMVSVKDVNGDGRITFGVQESGATTSNADIIEMKAPADFTEAPWLYRRRDVSGNGVGDYYLFYAHSWREQMAYAAIEEESVSGNGLMNGVWGGEKVIMKPAATSNTNHMAVFDFGGKTYFIYHNGSLPGGSGFRRSACITELKFNEDGSIDLMDETSAGLWGTTSMLYAADGSVLTHASFVNSGDDAAYPYTGIAVKSGTDKESPDAEWVLVDGKADPSEGSYVSIQSENKPGLYLTVNEDRSVTLAQDYDLNALAETAERQTFQTVEGLAGSGVSFESVALPGYYLTLVGDNQLCVTDGALKAYATFGVDEKPVISDAGQKGSQNSLKSVSVADEGCELTGQEGVYAVSVPYDKTSVAVTVTLEDPKGWYTLNGVVGTSGKDAIVLISSKTVEAAIQIYAEDGTKTGECTLTVTKRPPEINDVDLSDNVVYTFGFEDSTDGAFAVSKATVPAPVAEPAYQYTEGKNGKAILLNGAYGLELGEAKPLGDNYTISFWMKPDKLKGGVDPIFTAGTFSPEHWLNMTFSRPMWSNYGGYFDDAGTVSYTAGEWQHVLLTVQGGSGKLYVNGELKNSGTVAAGIMTCSGAKLYFGVNAWDALFEGAVDEIVLMDRVATEREILALSYNLITVESIRQAIEEKKNPIQTEKPSAEKPLTVSAPVISSVTNAAAGIRLEWNKVSGATGYYVYRDGKSIKTVTGSGALSYTDTEVKGKNGTKYTYTVCAYRTESGKTAVSKASAAADIYRLTAPAAPKLKALTGRKLKVSYKKNKQATGYEVQYSLKKDFRDAKTKKIKNKKTVSVTLKSLKKSKKYYVRVRAVKKVGGKTYYSAWSSTKNKKVK